VQACNERSGAPSVVPLEPRVGGPSGFAAEVAIDPAHAAIVMSHVEGRVASIRVNLAEHVRANDVVATVEPTRGGRAVELRSPIDGEVVERPGSVGQFVNTQQANPLVYVANLGTVWIVISVSQSELPRVRVGQRAELHLAMYPDRVFDGVVSRVLPMIDPQTGSAHVVLEMPNPDGALRPGARGWARLPTEVSAAPASSSPP
jgi:multidrug efflux pump subunit AcrA (membrane-fusion protein)